MAAAALPLDSAGDVLAAELNDGDIILLASDTLRNGLGPAGLSSDVRRLSMPPAPSCACTWLRAGERKGYSFSLKDMPVAELGTEASPGPASEERYDSQSFGRGGTGGMFFACAARPPPDESDPSISPEDGLSLPPSPCEWTEDLSLDVLPLREVGALP